MAGITSFHSKPWKLAIINAYIKQQNCLSIHNIPKLIHFLIAKYFHLDEKFKQLGFAHCKIENYGSILKTNWSRSEAIGTIPFCVGTKKTYIWTFYIENCKLTTWDNISFGVQDEAESVTLLYHSHGTREISPDHACCHRITFPYGEEFDKNDQISLQLTNKHLSFKKNGIDLGIAFDDIFRIYCHKKKVIITKFYCFVHLHGGAQINLINFQII